MGTTWLPSPDEAIALVQASMLALERGEIVCIPTLEDLDQLHRHDEAELAILTAGMRPAPGGALRPLTEEALTPDLLAAVTRSSNLCVSAAEFDFAAVKNCQKVLIV